MKDATLLHSVADQLDEAQIVLFAAHSKAKELLATSELDAIGELLDAGGKFALYLTALIQGQTDDESLVQDAIAYCTSVQAIAQEL